jgi:putative DNA primase/helicase
MDTTEQLAQLLKDAIVKPDLSEYLERQEFGDAELFSVMFAGKAVFDHSERRWYLWDGHHWKADIIGEVFGLVANQLAAEYLGAAKEARQRADDKLSESFIRRCHELRNIRRIQHVLELASKLPDIRIKGTEWDAQPMQLPVSNGILDLRDGSFRATVPSDYVRAYAPTEWHGLDYPAPQWEKALRDIFCDDSQLIDFFRRLCGYAITGDRREQILPVLWGQGANGKSTVMDTLSSVLGQDLCFTTQSDSLMDLGRSDANAARPFISALRNKRLVLASESGEGRRLNAGLVKQLTGDRDITARNLYAGPVTFRQTHTIMLITNHCPRLSDGDDYAVWRRVLRIPFNMRFVDDPVLPDQRKSDRLLGEKLKAEGPGILAWLVRGCLEWQRHGLNPPATVTESTARYREEEDIVGQFICDRLVVHQGLEATAGTLYKEYTNWCDAGGYKPISAQVFGQRLTARFGASVMKRIGQKPQRVYQGVGIPQATEST